MDYDNKEGSSDHDVSASAVKQKQLEDWLPVTASRNAKWWYSAFHNPTAMVGAGVLSLPYAMAHMGWFMKHFVRTAAKSEPLIGSSFLLPSTLSLYNSLISTLLLQLSCLSRVIADVDYSIKSESTSDGVFHFFSALGDVAFAYNAFNSREAFQDLHCYWSIDNDTISYWCHEEYHRLCQELQVFLMSLSNHCVVIALKLALVDKITSEE
ncbi:hypothetical protein PIB30_011657 [Stylosanthes scabra]|uniref:Amino acid transporter transmembrane domain-containing protein n=1 Tax=Stylosanthes scabra TaxID=79078 RepID=A0ABU6X4L6_9FABA|nr:hypothetical protein [Stylosanthes scabra]